MVQPASKGSSFAAGDVIDGKFQVERVLGVGGMGIVLAARDLKLGRRVALKFLLDEAVVDPAHVERFGREARAAARLQSEHSVHVLEVGSVRATGVPYIVMEYLTGSDLADALERSGQLPVADAVHYVLQACAALAEAHALGIVHRDVKPRNLFLTRTVDGRAVVKVLDFGLAKAASDTGDVAALSMTSTGAVIGSPLYMSPEQLRTPRDVDERADIWALGICLFEMLAGDVPFTGPTLPTVHAVILCDPTPAVRARRADVPEALDAVITRCLEKDRAKRFRDVAELADALAPFAPPAAAGLAERVRRSRSEQIAPSQRPPRSFESSGSAFAMSATHPDQARSTPSGAGSALAQPAMPSTRSEAPARAPGRAAYAVAVVAGTLVATLAVAAFVLLVLGGRARAPATATATTTVTAPTPAPTPTPTPSAEASPSSTSSAAAPPPASASTAASPPASVSAARGGAAPATISPSRPRAGPRARPSAPHAAGAPTQEQPSVFDRP